MRYEDNQEYFNDPDFLHILNQYEQMEAGGPKAFLDADDLTDVAEYYLIVKDDEARARACIDYALQLFPQATSPLIFQARQHLLNDDLDTTQQLCDAIPDQEDREVIFLNAEIMVRRKLTSAAVQYLLDKGKTIEYDYDYYLYDGGCIFIDYAEWEAAHTLAKHLCSYAPDWYKAWHLMADALLGLSQWKEALTYINRMLDADTFSIETWNWASEAYSGSEAYEKAVEAADYALAVEPDNVRATQLKAHAFLHMQLYEQAMQLYNEVLDRVPDDEATMAFMTYCYLCMDQVEKARQTIEQAELLADGNSPEQQMIYEQHANVLAAMGRYDEAISYIDKAQAEGDDGKTDYNAIRADFRRRRDLGE